MKIAVCDDSREDRGALRALLEACGHDFEIREYGSGEELYADMGYVRECGIVLLDINMEGMDGLEAAGKGFVRIHQSFLINMRYIGKLSSYVMVLTTGKEISVPKSRYPEVKRQYTLFKGAE